MIIVYCLLFCFAHLDVTECGGIRPNFRARVTNLLQAVATDLGYGPKQERANFDKAHIISLKDMDRYIGGYSPGVNHNNLKRIIELITTRHEDAWFYHKMEEETKKAYNTLGDIYKEEIEKNFEKFSNNPTDQNAKALRKSMFNSVYNLRTGNSWANSKIGGRLDPSVKNDDPSKMSKQSLAISDSGLVTPPLNYKSNPNLFVTSDGPGNTNKRNELSNQIRATCSSARKRRSPSSPCVIPLTATSEKKVPSRKTWMRRHGLPPRRKRMKGVKRCRKGVKNQRRNKRWRSKSLRRRTIRKC